MCAISATQQPKQTLADVCSKACVVVKWSVSIAAAIACAFLPDKALLIIVCAAFTIMFSFALTLAVADADLGLLAQGSSKPGHFKDKVVLLVGASRGLGAALAQYLCSEGAIVILSARNTSQLEKVKASLVGENASMAEILPVDVTDSADSLANYARDADALFDSGVHYAFLAAGASQSARTEDTQEAIARQVFEINALGLMAVARALLPVMLKRGKGHLVPISSMAGKVASPGQAEYAGAKHALVGYFSSLGSEVASRGVQVTIACPGPVAGGGSRTVFGASGMIQKNEDASSNSKKVPMQRCCQLICNAVAHGRAEACIAKHPVLAVYYLSRFIPERTAKLLRKVGGKRASALAEGKSGYDYDLARDSQKDK